jgi:phage tail sheath protein FI
MSTRGVNIYEVPTGIQSPVTADAGIPFVVGSAPVNMVQDQAGAINKVVFAHTYEEAVAALGFVAANPLTGLFEYSLCEFIKSHFALFGASPVAFVNVLNPATTTHKTVVPVASVSLEGDSAVIAQPGILLDTLVVKDSEAATTYIIGTDYDVTFNSAGNLVVHRLAAGDIAANAELKINFSKLNPAGVTAAEVIGGVDVSGVKSGMELIADVFPRFRSVVGFVAAPSFSGDPLVAAIMKAKAKNINGNFNAVAVIDVPTGTVKTHAAVAAWKNDNNITDPNQIVCWPMVSLGGEKYHLSTQLIGLANQVDASIGGIPSESPSNKNLQMDSMVLRDGTEVTFGTEIGSNLNANGIVTATNFTQGWTLWGNRTAAYPGNSDVKDAFVPIRRMYNWVGNTLILSNFQNLDQRMLPRTVQMIVDSNNIWLNGLVADGHLYEGSRIELLQSENPITSLLDGKIKYHVFLSPPPPLEQIDFVLEYDPAGLESLFN